jgi:serine protease
MMRLALAGAAVWVLALGAVTDLSPAIAEVPERPIADPSVVVAVLDTGITAHPDLGWRQTKTGAGRPGGAVLPGYDFVSDPWSAMDGDGWDSDPSDRGDGVRLSELEGRTGCRARLSSWHGTNVAGTIAARRAKNRGITGIAYGASILPVRILGRCGGNTGDVAAALLWASGHPVPGVPLNQHPSRIINLSLSGTAPQCPRSLQMAIDIAVGRGAVVVVAAGSLGGKTATSVPANCMNVIVVGATNFKNRRTPTSNAGKEVTVSAPGGDMSIRESDGVFTTTNSGNFRPRKPKFGYYQGSSAATAYVSAVLAVLLSRQPDLSGPEIRAIVTRPDVLTAFAPGQCDVGDGLCGAGILRIEKVLEAFPAS